MLKCNKPLSDFIWFLPYGAEEKFPQNIKHVGAIAEYPAKAHLSYSENKFKFFLHLSPVVNKLH